MGLIQRYVIKLSQFRSPEFHGFRNAVWRGMLGIVVACLMYPSTAIAQDKAPDMVITTRAGEQHQGRLLYATDTLLVLWLWSCDTSYTSSQLDAFAKVFYPFEIERIVIERENKLWSGLGKGFLIGGGIGGTIGFIGGITSTGMFSGPGMAMLGFILFGVPSAIISGVVGAAQGIDDDFTIGGNDETYKALMPRFKKSALFPSDLLPPELQTLVERSHKQSS